MKGHSIFQTKSGVLIIAIITTFLWGSAFPFIKLSYQRLEILPSDFSLQLKFAGERFFLAAIFIFIFMWLTKRNLRINKGDVKGLVILGFYQTFLTYLLFYVGLSHSTGIQSAVITGSTAIFQIIFASMMFKEGISPNKILGMIFGLSGVYVVNMSGSSKGISIGYGELILIASVIMSAYSNLRAKRYTKTMDVMIVTSYQMLFGSIGLLLLSLVGESSHSLNWDMGSLQIFAYLSALSAVTFVLWNQLMKYNSVAKISVFMFLIPVFGVVLSSLILGEIITITHCLGLLLVVIGILIVFLVEGFEIKKHLLGD